MSEAIDRVHYLFAFRTLISLLRHKTLTDVILSWRQYLRSAVVVKSLHTLKELEHHGRLKVQWFLNQAQIEVLEKFFQNPASLYQEQI